MSVIDAKVLKAFCVEIGDEITISEARREYLNIKNPPVRFNFFCNDHACLSVPNKVRITGVNYRAPAEEKKKYVVPHFRTTRKNFHHPECKWLREQSEEVESNEGGDQVSSRNARRKMTDLVTSFDPRPNTNHADDTGDLAAENGSAGENVSGNEGKSTVKGSNGNRPGETRTSDLDRLVDSYVEARDILSYDEFSDLRLRIVRHKTVRYKDYFQWIAKFNGEGVAVGGVKIIDIYGYGFKLTFHDKIKNAKISLYVSSERLLKYKYHRFIKSAIDTVRSSGNKKYLRAYTMGSLEYSEKFSEWSLLVDDLNHLVLRVIEKAPLDETFL